MAAQQNSTPGMTPPHAAARETSLNGPFGTRIDPYAWLRDDSRRDPEVMAHLRAENAYTQSALAPLARLERRLLKELTDRMPPDDSTVPFWYRGHWVWERYQAGQEYSQLMRLAPNCPPDSAQVLLDLNELAIGAEYFELGDWAIAPDGRRLAYTADRVGRRQYELFVRDLSSGQIDACGVTNIEADIVWCADSERVLVIAKDERTLLSNRVCLIHLSDASLRQEVLYEEPDASYYLGLSVSRSEELVFLSCASTDQTQWWFADLRERALRFEAVLPRERGHDYDVEHDGAHFLLRTNRAAPDFRLVRVPIAQRSDLAQWQDLLPAQANAVLEDFEIGTRHLAVVWRRQGETELTVYHRDGAHLTPQRTLPAPAAGVLSLISTPDLSSPFVRFHTSSLIEPGATYDLDIGDGAVHLRQRERVLGGFDSANYLTQRLWVSARDGTQVPVTVAHHRRTAIDATAPGYLYAYGAYGIACDPDFADSWVSLMDRGFVVAVAHVRGGGDLGRRWYEQGRRDDKMNTFTDFIDVRRALVAARFVDPAKMCAQGGSAGGLLIGAVANQAPDEFCALVAHVPFVDVLNTMLDDTLPLTSNEYEEWGDPRNAHDYDTILRYAPYENLRAQHYPAMMVFTALWDSQVQYFEPVKWVARLRSVKQDEKPLLLQIDMGSGHGGRSGRYAAYRDVAREYAFLLWQTGLANPETAT